MQGQLPTPSYKPSLPCPAARMHALPGNSMQWLAGGAHCCLRVRRLCSQEHYCMPRRRMPHWMTKVSGLSSLDCRWRVQAQPALFRSSSPSSSRCGAELCQVSTWL
jgi:hypothetical protein